MANVGEWVSEHPQVAVGGVVVVLFIGYMLIKKNQTTQPTTNTATGTGSTADLSGLTTDSSGNKVVYVPTQTNFITRNNTVGSNVNSPNSTTATSSVSAPAATSVSAAAPVASSTSVTNTVNTVTNTTTNTNVPTRVPTPQPPMTHKGALVWDQRYVVKSGDNLSYIASRLTSMLRQQGLPGSLSVSYNDIYGHNQSVINGMALQHGVRANQINYVYPGEGLVVPRWDKNAG